MTPPSGWVAADGDYQFTFKDDGVEALRPCRSPQPARPWCHHPADDQLDRREGRVFDRLGVSADAEIVSRRPTSST